MIQSLTFAALLVAGSLATTATLLNDPKATGLGALDASASEQLTRRGTRESVLSASSVDSIPALQPRRGARPELVVSETAPLDEGPGVRRGER